MSSGVREELPPTVAMPDVFGPALRDVFDPRSATSAGGSWVSARRSGFAPCASLAPPPRDGVESPLLLVAFASHDSRPVGAGSAGGLHCRREPSAEITCQVLRGTATSSDNGGTVAGARGLIAFFGDAVMAGSRR